MIRLAIIVALLSTWTAYGQDFPERTLGLRQGMEKADVRNALGRSPNFSEMKTCGGKNGPSWFCEVWHYLSRTQDGCEFLVYFDEGKLNSWNFSAFCH